ncbi:glutathione-dependent formaldehyde-activating, GFA [Saccharata proteae CBS 121410]|uniref:Glutathione-dependent formaldehyde-activating, GFA n=1 Tax=Saccharata proteae CBS 121410 TaxID=1314787 RepID=A0A9P4I297_9PEZI|nr:glutathione-dependent formaldehyde-activating, GFA [Saccharata proteae CBS 121410]
MPQHPLLPIEEVSPNLVTYTCHCHCGAIKFSATLPSVLETPVLRCNCSACTRFGYLLVYPKAGDVVFSRGEQELKSYRFGTKTLPHRFCGTCGSSLLIDFADAQTDMLRGLVGLNLRCFADAEALLPKVQYKDVDGWGMLNPPYSVE